MRHFLPAPHKPPADGAGVDVAGAPNNPPEGAGAVVDAGA